MNNCPLMKIMCEQIKGDDYNNPLLWQYERIDEICNSLKIYIIDTQLQRKCLSIYLEDIYKSFDDYLLNISIQKLSLYIEIVVLLQIWNIMHYMNI